jgi:hypothetical protein
VARGQHDAPPLGGAYAGARAAEGARAAAAHLDEDQGGIALAQYEVDLAAATARRPIIALDQAQAGRQQVGQCRILGQLAPVPGRGGRRPRACRLFRKETQ